MRLARLINLADSDSDKRTPEEGRTYCAFAIAPRETEATGADARHIAVLDLDRNAKPPFSPDSVVKMFADLPRSYRVNTAVTVKFGGEFAKVPFSPADARYAVFQMAEVAVSRDLFRRILDMIDDLRPRELSPC